MRVGQMPLLWNEGARGCIPYTKAFEDTEHGSWPWRVDMHGSQGSETPWGQWGQLVQGRVLRWLAMESRGISLWVHMGPLSSRR